MMRVMTNIILSRKIAKGEILTQTDSADAYEYSINDIKFIFSFTYVFKPDNSYIFKTVEYATAKENKETYKFNSLTGTISIKSPKKKDFLIKYDSGKQTLQNILKEKDNGGPLLLFSKSDLDKLP
jgi:hypothetical protein